MAKASTGQSRAIGRMLSLLVVIAMVLAAFLPWLDGGLLPYHQPSRDLVQGISDHRASAMWTSISVPLLAAALLSLIAMLFASRTFAWLSFIVSLATTGLWTALTAAHRGSLNASHDLRFGYWCAVAGVVLGLLAAAISWRKPT
jgi:hypothetical protein